MKDYPYSQEDKTPELDAQAQDEGERQAETQIKALRQTADETAVTLSILFNMRGTLSLLSEVTGTLQVPALKGGTILKARGISALGSAEEALHDLYLHIMGEHEDAAQRLRELGGDDEEPPF